MTKRHIGLRGKRGRGDISRERNKQRGLKKEELKEPVEEKKAPKLGREREKEEIEGVLGGMRIETRGYPSEEVGGLKKGVPSSSACT